MLKWLNMGAGVPIITYFYIFSFGDPSGDILGSANGPLDSIGGMDSIPNSAGSAFKIRAYSNGPFGSTPRYVGCVDGEGIVWGWNGNSNSPWAPLLWGNFGPSLDMQTLTPNAMVTFLSSDATQLNLVYEGGGIPGGNTATGWVLGDGSYRIAQDEPALGPIVAVYNGQAIVRATVGSNWVAAGVSPSDPQDIAIICTDTGRFLFADGPDISASDDGMASKASVEFKANTLIVDLFQSQGLSPQVIFALRQDTVTAENSEVLVSTDDGATWTVIETPLNLIGGAGQFYPFYSGARGSNTYVFRVFDSTFGDWIRVEITDDGIGGYLFSQANDGAIDLSEGAIA